MLAGEAGFAPQWAMRHQVAVGQFFDAPDLVPVGQAHIMAATESLGEAGVVWLEGLAALLEPQRRVRVPTITELAGSPSLPTGDSSKPTPWPPSRRVPSPPSRRSAC